MQACREHTHGRQMKIWEKHSLYTVWILRIELILLGLKVIPLLARSFCQLLLDTDIFKIPKFSSNKSNSKVNFDRKQNYMRKKVHCEC